MKARNAGGGTWQALWPAHREALSAKRHRGSVAAAKSGGEAAAARGGQRTAK